MKIQDLSPDTILSNGQIYTLNPAGSIAQAVAIKEWAWQMRVFLRACP